MEHGELFGNGWKLKCIPDLPRLRENERACCVYSIECEIISMRYIGSAKNLWNRMKSHFSHLVIGDHVNHNLQHAYNQHGLAHFNWVILEHCKLHELEEREQYWINYYPPVSLFNIASKVARKYPTMRINHDQVVEYMSIWQSLPVVKSGWVDWFLVSDLRLKTEYDFWYPVKVNNIDHALGGKHMVGGLITP